jgi:hypothetical protein
VNYKKCISRGQIGDIELYVVMSFSALLWLQVGVVCGERDAACPW